MSDINGRPNEIEDVLVRLHTGDWFKWNGVEKIYSNLEIVDNTKTKPTEEELNAKLVEIQNEFDNRENKKASAKQKLQDLGLTTEEIKEAFGI